MTDDLDLTQRLCDATIGALELFGVHLGTTLGLYDALDRHGPSTFPELADRAGIHPRYAQEWCEQQAVAGYLTVASPSAAAETIRFALPDAHRGALLDPVDGDHVAPFAPMVVGIAQVLDQVVDAYRTGAGVPYADYGTGFRDGQGAINRPAFTSDLVKAWIPAVPGLAERLSAGARVLDVGTGQGWSAISIQAAWPAAEVVGLDTDPASILDARAHAQQAGVDVRFVEPAADGTEIADLGPVDVAFVIEALHDMSRPGDVLRSLRQVLADDGAVIVIDEAVAEAFSPLGDDIERMMYGWSIVHCLPAAMAEEGAAAIGTAIRPSTVAALAADAGFSASDVVDVDAGFFRIYLLSAGHMTTIPTTTPTPAVARATAWDRGRLVNVLSAAFADDPVFTWIEPDPTRRAAILPPTFGAFAAAFARHETTDLVRIDGAAAGAALWAPPGVEPIHPDDADLIGEAMGVYTPEAQERIGALMAAFEAAHPNEPAWYLNFLGVTPARQGLGLGSALLRPVLHRADVAGHGAYLEATSERNRTLYERHGFRCIEDIPLPGGPVAYAMGRKAVRP